MPTDTRQKYLHTFNIDHLSDMDGQRYQGAFTTKKMSVKDLTTLGVRKTQHNGGFNYDPSHPGYGVDEQTDEFSHMLAHLEISIVDAPFWWNLDEIADMDLVGKVYKEVVEHENKFLRRRGAAAEGSGNSSEGNSSQTEDVSNSSGGAGEVVDGQVQPSLEP